MRGPARTRSIRSANVARRVAPGSLRDRLAILLALVTVVCLIAVFFLAKDTQFLMPGPLTSAHSSIKQCDACHSRSGSGKLSWLYGLVAGDPLADSQACLTCHNMRDTAFNAHGASPDVLLPSTQRLAKLAAGTPVPRSARAQSIAFPTDDKVTHGLYCATCHQEHQGANFKLNKISNEQCHSCHVVKFDSFDGNHPEFENFPFGRRSRIIYDHAGHFGKHFPEVAKKDPARSIPATCSSCHNSHRDRRVMGVVPFEQTCSTCHLDQIIGKERVSGPKGIAFLTLPGVDLQTLKKRKAAIGEWPASSEAELTPFMKMMIGRNERGRALIKSVDGLTLQDLSRASDAQVQAVASLVWEIKRLFYALIKGKASDVLADLNVGAAAKLSANLVADLTASIPRDVIVSAQQQWLPNLAAEMTNRPVPASSPLQVQSGSGALQANSKRSAQAPSKGAAEKVEAASSASVQARSDESGPPAKPPGSDTDRATPGPGPESGGNDAATSKAKPNPRPCLVAVFGQCLLPSGPEAEGVQSEAAAPQTDAANPKLAGGRKEAAAAEPPRANQARVKDAAQSAQPEKASRTTQPVNAKPEGGEETALADQRPHKRPADQTDDLLNPTEEELRGLTASDTRKVPQSGKATEKRASDKPGSAVSAAAVAKANASLPTGAPAGSDTAVEKPQTRAVPVTSIEGDVDAESWADYGGWYRQDYAIFYRPAGHKDKFVQSWLLLTGLQAPKGDRNPAVAVFDLLTAKDAPGACTKCHSIDDIGDKGRIVNFSPPSVESKKGRFTNFIHEPHFGILESRGCLTCHSLEKGRSYLQGYEQGNPATFVSNFGAVKKDLCQTCHTASMVRQDCLLCHKYHVNGVTTPIMNTRTPIE